MIVSFEALNCALVPKPHGIAGKCDKCATSLPPRRRRWCSDKCARGFYHEAARNHDWPVAREAALHRDGHRCVRCGAKGSPPADEVTGLGKSPVLPDAWPRGPYKTKAEQEALAAWYRSDEYAVYAAACKAHNTAHEALFRRYQLEVNHIAPCMGQHAARSCAHHLDNLETLCGVCHKQTTAQQARDRADNRRGRIPLAIRIVTQPRPTSVPSVQRQSNAVLGERGTRAASLRNGSNP